jgi:hypothetical protein
VHHLRAVWSDAQQWVWIFGKWAQRPIKYTKPQECVRKLCVLQLHCRKLCDRLTSISKKLRNNLCWHDWNECMLNLKRRPTTEVGLNLPFVCGRNNALVQSRSSWIKMYVHGVFQTNINGQGSYSPVIPLCQGGGERNGMNRSSCIGRFQEFCSLLAWTAEFVRHTSSTVSV